MKRNEATEAQKDYTQLKAGCVEHVNQLGYRMRIDNATAQNLVQDGRAYVVSESKTQAYE